MKITPILFAAGMSLAVAATASAQPVGVGVSKGGSVNQMGSIISKVVSEHTDVQMRPRPMGGVQQYAAAVNAAQLEFGMLSSMQFAMNYFGTHVSEGDKKENLRIVASLVPFRTGMMVQGNTGITHISELKGKRVSWGFSSAPLLQFFLEGMLANGGLTGDDIVKVPITGLQQSFQAIKTGKADSVPVSIGAGVNKEIANALDGGIRVVSLSPDPAAVARLHQFVPRTIVTEVKPAPSLVEIKAPTYTLGYYYMLCTNKNTPDALVAKVVKAIAEHEQELKASSPVWREYHTPMMSMDHDLPYHDAAIAYYKANGMWKR